MFGNSASKADAIIFMLGLKAAAKAGKTGWQAIEATATVAREIVLATQNAAAARAIVAFEHPIATHSHECMDLECRRPVKLTSHYKKGRMYANFTHVCLAQKNNKTKGLAKHLCSTCHQTGMICKDAVFRYPKCSTSKQGCAHLHDGSGIPRK